MRIRGHFNIRHDSNSIHRICTTMGTNIILRGNSNYKNNLSNSLRRKRSHTMTMRKLLSITTHTEPILLLTLSNPVSNRSFSISTPNTTTQNRIIKPTRNKHPIRQSKILQNIHNQRPLIFHSTTSDNNNSMYYKSKLTRRCRKLQHSKNHNNPSTHPTRVILSIRIRNPTINPIQTRGGTCNNSSNFNHHSINN